MTNQVKATPVSTPETVKAIAFINAVGDILKLATADGKFDLTDLQYLDNLYVAATTDLHNVAAIPTELKSASFEDFVTLGSDLAHAGFNLWQGVTAAMEIIKAKNATNPVVPV